MDLRHLQIGIHLLFNADEMAVAREIVNALFEGLVSHCSILLEIRVLMCNIVY